jgi:hypothetical protein
MFSMNKLLALVVLVLIACSAHKPAPPPKPKTPAELCVEFFTLACTKIMPCNPTNTADETAACIEAAAEGACPMVESLRDREALEKVCLPWLGSLKCETLEEAMNNIPPACMQQFR